MWTILPYFAIGFLVIMLGIGFAMWNKNNDEDALVGCAFVGFVVFGLCLIPIYIHHKDEDKYSNMTSLFEEKYQINVLHIKTHGNTPDVIIFKRKGHVCAAEALNEASNGIINLDTIDCYDQRNIDAKLPAS